MVKTMRGKLLDMGALFTRNQNALAIGNANVNARGDKIGRKGKIVKTREQIDREIRAYNRENPNAVKRASMSALETEVLTPAQVMAKMANAAKQKAVAPVDVMPNPVQIESTPTAPVNAKTRKLSDAE